MTSVLPLNMSCIKAIRVSCRGETNPWFKVKEYSTYEIAADHDIFTHGEPSQLSILAGVPLLVMQLRPSLVQPRNAKHDMSTGARHEKPSVAYGYGQDGNFFPNPVAASLMVRCMGATDDATPLLSTPKHWTDKVGSVLIARQDGKPLQALHISILLAFVAAAVEQGDMSDEAKIKELVTPGAFKVYYASAMEFLAAADEKQDWESIPSPFEDQEEKTSPREGDATSATMEMLS